MSSKPCLKNRMYRVKMTDKMASTIKYGPAGMHGLAAFFTSEHRPGGAFFVLVLHGNCITIIIIMNNTVIIASFYIAPTSKLNYYPRRAWTAAGIVVCWFVCLCMICESTHLDAIALRLFTASTQQVISFLIGQISIKALLLYRSEQKLRSLNLHIG